MPFDAQDVMREATTTARSESTSNLLEEVYSTLSQGMAQNQQGLERTVASGTSSVMAQFGALELFDSGSAGAEQGLQDAVFNPQTDTVHFSGREQEQVSRAAAQSRATETAQERPNMGGIDVEERGVNLDFEDKKGGHGAFNANRDGAHVEFDAPGTSVEGNLDEHGLKFGAATREGGVGIQVSDQQTSVVVDNNRGTGIGVGRDADNTWLNLGLGGRQLGAQTDGSSLGVKYTDSEGGEWNFDLG